MGDILHMYTISALYMAAVDGTIEFGERHYTAKATDYKKGISDAEATSEVIRSIQDRIDHIDNLYSLNVLMTEIKDRSMI